MGQFEKIQAFVQVVDSRSFSIAARKLRCSVPAISKQIKTLEEELKLNLLERSTRTLALTEVGQAYYDRCTLLIQGFQDTQNLASQLTTEPQGILRVVATRYFGKKYIIPHLMEFTKKYPQIKLDIELAERIPNLRAEKIDVLFALSLPGEPDWIRKPLTKTRYIFCASPAYIKKNGSLEKPSDLSRHFYINHAMRTPLNILDFGDGLKYPVQSSLILNDTFSMVKCGLAGLGIIRLHEYMVTNYINDGRLVELLPQYNSKQVTVYVYYPTSQFIPAKVKQFIEFFNDRIKQALPTIQVSSGKAKGK